MSLIQGTSVTGAGGAAAQYEIERSLRFNSADSAYLNRTPASASNRRTFTWSGWLKRGKLGSFTTFFSGVSTSTVLDYLSFDADGKALISSFNGVDYIVRTKGLLRDPSAWYHLIIAFDSTQATSTNRVKIYVNGVDQTDTTGSYPTQNYDTQINNNVVQYVGYNQYNYWDGYLTEINFIDGQALDATSFGETNPTTGVWQPKKYTGTYGTNGFYLNFSDNSGTTSTTLGKDSSGNGNNWTPNNFSVTAGAGNDSLVDTPTSYGTDTGAGGEVRGNYATLNPLINPSADTFSNGNLQVVTSSSNYGTSVSTLATPTTGKWYAECTITATAGYPAVGICSTSSVFTATSWIGSFIGVTYLGSTGQKVVNASSSAYGATYGANDVIGIAYDADNLQITFYKNGTTQGTITGVTAGSYYFGSSEWDTASGTQVWNFGQRPFAYTAPSGFKALCTQNLPDPTIVDGGEYFNTVLYTGTGSTRSVTGVGFQPDWVWIKQRGGATNHALYDVIRGGTNALRSNTTGAESQYGDAVLTYQSDGFQIAGTNVSGVNGSTESLVAWNWKANGAGSSNTAGTITSTVSVNTTSGFSIVTYTGTGANATVGHGLGVAPSMIIVKNRDQADAWQVYHAANTANPETDYLVLNTTAATADAADRWNDTLPTSTVFSIGNGVEVNTNTEKYVAYCFAPVAGYSAFGSYTGNGSADGPFVYTGFRPAYVLIKNASATGDWFLYDTARNTYNVADSRLKPNLADAEGTGGSFGPDILSNGFKMRSDFGEMNGNGNTIIYMAFASNPFKYALAR